MITESTLIPGLYWVRAERHPDERGSFTETWRKSWVPGCREWVQQNRGYSVEGVLRGLHVHRFQRDHWRCESGRAFVAFADLRKQQPIVEAGWMDDPSVSVYIPEGVAHGYCAPTGDVVLTYQVDRYYDPDDEHAVRWDDPVLGVRWPISRPNLSARDSRAPLLNDVSPVLRQALRDLLPR